MLFLSFLKTFYKRSPKRKADCSADTDARRSDLEHYDKKIAELEQEFHDLMASGPPNVSRLSQIVSELGRLWNAKLRDEQKVPLADGDKPKDMAQLQKAVNEIVREGKKKMGKARGEEEIRAAFTDSLNKMISLFDE